MSIHRRRAILRTAAVTAVACSALLMPAVSAVAAGADSPAHARGAKATEEVRHTQDSQDAKGGKTVAPVAAVAQVAPKGSVKAGTEGFQSGDPVFIAAGGAMAAAGAAGLGYSMLRRGRTDT